MFSETQMELDDSVSSDCSSCSSLDFSDLREEYFYSESLVICNDSLTECELGKGNQAQGSHALDDQFGQFVRRNGNNIKQKPDIKFLVGVNKTPVYGIKQELSSKCPEFSRLILAHDSVTYESKGKSKRIFNKVLCILKRHRDTRPVDPYLIIPLPEFAPDVFRTVIRFIEGEQINVDISNVIDVMNIADRFGLDDLRDACFRYARGFITVDHVLRLFVTLQPYVQFHWARQMECEINLFLNEHAEKIYRQEGFDDISEEIAVSLLSRKEVCVSAETKWDAALRWSRRHYHGNPRAMIYKMNFFSSYISTSNIPLVKLLDEVNSSLGKEHTNEKIVSVNIMSRTEHSSFSSKSKSLRRNLSGESIRSDSSMSTESGYISSRESC